MGESFILFAGADIGKASRICLGGLSFSPSGETGEGFVCWLYYISRTSK
jgi:hypothetical protein